MVEPSIGWTDETGGENSRRSGVTTGVGTLGHETGCASTWQIEQSSS